jgi:hypothetical protein
MTRFAVAIHPHVTPEQLLAWDLDDGFETFGNGDAGQLRALLTGVLETPEGRLAVATGLGGRIVGFICVVPPDAGERFHTVVPAAELSAFEVATSHRGRGVFSRMFHATFRDTLEERILYTICDPALRLAGESRRTFRDRLRAVLGSVGFAAYPTDHPSAHVHRDAFFMARVGRGVPVSDVESFVGQLYAEPAVRVAIALRDSALRNMIRVDLERNGLEVVAVSSGARAVKDVDALVTETGSPDGAPVTVRLTDDDETRIVGSTIWQATSRLEHLAGTLRREVRERSRGHE